jgi:RNA polymerase sigma factor (sigma-70 family)
LEREAAESPIESLVLRAQQGRDASAFARLIDHYERTALSLAYATCGNSATAADVVQEAFLRCWQRLDELKDPPRFGAWLGRIVRNLATDSVRRGRRPTESLDENLSVPASTAGFRDPDERMLSRETRQQLDAALATLDEVTRSAVVLRYYQDLSSKQIGELLELSPAAVDMRLSRARAQLREALCETGWNDQGNCDPRPSETTVAGAMR